MTFASAVFFLGFTLLISLGIFALGLVAAASVFALIAAGIDIARFVSRWIRFGRMTWHGFGETGRQFVFCWGGVALCVLLATTDLVAPRPILGDDAPLDGFDLLGIALAFPALVQIMDRITRKRNTHV
ncbi:MAG: hypothetical protein H7145_02550 [Akkermansiaceae bacterium]|nr:hypothetical protein [Armatimonadota bacterium]